MAQEANALRDFLEHYDLVEENQFLLHEGFDVETIKEVVCEMTCDEFFDDVGRELSKKKKKKWQVLWDSERGVIDISNKSAPKVDFETSAPKVDFESSATRGDFESSAPRNDNKNTAPVLSLGECPNCTKLLVQGEDLKKELNQTKDELKKIRAENAGVVAQGHKTNAKYVNLVNEHELAQKEIKKLQEELSLLKEERKFEADERAMYGDDVPHLEKRKAQSSDQPKFDSPLYGELTKLKDRLEFCPKKDYPLGHQNLLDKISEKEQQIKEFEKDQLAKEGSGSAGMKNADAMDTSTDNFQVDTEQINELELQKQQLSDRVQLLQKENFGLIEDLKLLQTKVDSLDELKQKEKNFHTQFRNIEEEKVKLHKDYGAAMAQINQLQAQLDKNAQKVHDLETNLEEEEVKFEHQKRILQQAIGERDAIQQKYDEIESEFDEKEQQLNELQGVEQGRKNTIQRFFKNLNLSPENLKQAIAVQIQPIMLRRYNAASLRQYMLEIDFGSKDRQEIYKHWLKGNREKDDLLKWLSSPSFDLDEPRKIAELLYILKGIDTPEKLKTQIANADFDIELKKLMDADDITKIEENCANIVKNLTVKEWLNDIGFPQYIDDITNQGYTHVQQLQQLQKTKKPKFKIVLHNIKGLKKGHEFRIKQGCTLLSTYLVEECASSPEVADKIAAEFAKSQIFTLLDLKNVPDTQKEDLIKQHCLNAPFMVRKKLRTNLNITTTPKPKQSAHDFHKTKKTGWQHQQNFEEHKQNFRGQQNYGRQFGGQQHGRGHRQGQGQQHGRGRGQYRYDQHGRGRGGEFVDDLPDLPAGGGRGRGGPTGYHGGAGHNFGGHHGPLPDHSGQGKTAKTKNPKETIQEMLDLTSISKADHKPILDTFVKLGLKCRGDIVTQAELSAKLPKDFVKICLDDVKGVKFMTRKKFVDVV